MPPAKRPGLASTAAVIEIVFSSLAIFLYLVVFVQTLNPLSPDMTQAIPGLISVILVFIFLLVSLLGLIGGIMLLANKRGGMGLSIFWSICELLYFLLILGLAVLLSLAGNSLASLMPAVNQFLADIILIILFALLAAGIPGLLVLCLLANKKSRAFYFQK